MINALKSLFVLPAGDSPEEHSHRVHLASAALLIETARADFTQDADEEAALENLLCESLSLSREEVHALVERASNRVDSATSLYEFTRVINDQYGPAEKLELIAAMWRVAYVDDNLDKYEEHLIRQVAELIYVPHQDYIRSKLEAKPD
ncbi:TerB family tellurite resistance protein [Haliea sp. E1-2-M8]|uniref:tellurite resistance TerB family protein n=1 Tax=Haliea sp. E1-2-M8 TaxID=3064706 RepID=UPI0027293D90|nr:TerB family tellurite resistance protein [Haliea sp. E1-2-M8]MDO8861196.1 TerB family tellurite resistance protein [Haliea sp. E1-2-M8]